MSRYNDEDDQNDLLGIVEVREGFDPSIYDKTAQHAEPAECTCADPAPIDIDVSGVWPLIECARCHRPHIRRRNER